MAAVLEVILGPMFAGKTTLLVERARTLSACGARVVVVRPRMDSRSTDGHIETHSGDRWPAASVRDAAELVGAGSGAQWTLLDEAHMLGSGGGTACLSLLAHGVNVIAAGVSLDHEGRPFAPLAELACHADRVHVVHGTCARCGGRSNHSYRRVRTEERIVVGGADLYEALCRGCFAQAVGETHNG